MSGGVQNAQGQHGQPKHISPNENKTSDISPNYQPRTYGDTSYHIQEEQLFGRHKMFYLTLLEKNADSEVRREPAPGGLLGLPVKDDRNDAP